MIKLLVFDLDGTLADTRLDLAASVNATLTRFELKTLETSQIIAFVGDGADDLIRKCLRSAGLSQVEADAKTPEVLREFLDYYQHHCMVHTHAYAGAHVLLEQFHGVKALLTNKPLKPTMRVLEGLGFQKHFLAVIPGDGPMGKKPDPRGMAAILSIAGVRPDEAVMIGDGIQDLRTARAAGTRSIAFLGGMGDPRALQQEGADAMVYHLDAIPAILGEWDRKRRVHG